MKPWKVLSVQSRYELSVERQLACMGIEHYLPKLESVRTWSDRIKKIQVPAFPNYIFVRNEERYRNEVFFVRGVLAYVRYDQRDATIKDEEMEVIRHFENNIRQNDDKRVFENGGRIRIEGGVFNGSYGRMRGLKKEGIVYVEFEEWKPGFIVEIPTGYLVSV